MNNLANQKVKDAFTEQLLATLDKIGHKMDVQYLCSAPRIRSDKAKVTSSKKDLINVTKV